MRNSIIRNTQMNLLHYSNEINIVNINNSWSLVLSGRQIHCCTQLAAIKHELLVITPRTA